MRREHIEALQFLLFGNRIVPEKRDHEFAWRAIKAVAAGDGVLSEPERECLLGRMLIQATPVEVIDMVMEWDEHSTSVMELMTGVQVPEQMRPGLGAWMVYVGLIVAYADGELAAGEYDAIKTVAGQMGVAGDLVDELFALVKEEEALRQRRMAIMGKTVPAGEEWRFDHS